MNPNVQAAHEAIRLARQAQLSGDKRAARRYAEQAVQFAPELEEGWLMLAALASPRASIAYLQQALKINPASERAQKGMQWAIARLDRTQEVAPQTAGTPPAEDQQAVTQQAATQQLVTHKAAAQAAVLQVPLAPTPHHPRQPAPGAIATRRISTPLILLLVLCAALGVAALSGILTPAISAPLGIGLASFRGGPAATEAVTPTQAGSPLDINQPTYTPLPTDTPTPTATFTPTATPTDTPTPLPTNTLLPPPTMVVYEPTALPTDSVSAGEVPSHGGERWIDVDLSNQMVYAYEGNSVVNSFLVSTGTWQYPTVTGQFHIWIKLRYTEMIGPGYDLPNVPYTMYFYKGYGLHGTYWHNNFGTPMSHGCVNLSIPDAEWLYNWASVGTLVNVHY
jgi:lipoprotein-anchoring transpeptidase ErfK/SrfK